MTANLHRWRRAAAVLIVLVGAMVLGSAGGACACTCIPSTDAEYAQRADLVFEGVVVDVDKPFLSGAGSPVTVRFAVESVIKGTAGDRVELRTPSAEESCGFSFTAGHRYRAYAAGGQTTQCSGNRDLGAAPDVPLDEGWPWALLAAALGVVVLVGLLAARRRRRRPF